jgi:hypothetical protein
MPAPRLHIVMPCSRPENIPQLAAAYLKEMEPHPWEVRWHIMLQGPEYDPKGTAKVNEGIDDVRGGWLMLISDDTDQHPALFRRLSETIEANPHAGAVVFNQDRHAGRSILLAKPQNMTPCYVCGGQVAWKRDFLGTNRYDYAKHGGTCDGELIRFMYRQAPESFVFVNETLTRFGSLEW